jgi:putative transposase
MFEFDSKMHCELYLHSLWSTKGQQPVISPAWSNKLCTFIQNSCNEKYCSVIASCAPVDHIQLLIKFTPEFILSEFLIDIKSSTTIWIRTHFLELKDFEWQESDFSFSVGYDYVGDVISKMNDQKNSAKAVAFNKLIPKILDENLMEYSKDEILT